MADDYTPTTAQIRDAAVASGYYASAEFDRWLAAHDAEKRAEWEAELRETEWEYGSEGAEGTDDPDPRPLSDDSPYWPVELLGVREPNAEQAAEIVAKWNEGDPGSARLIRRRKAGEWLPVTNPESGRTELVDNRDPECVKAWPGCHTFGYDPACCRFPKSCSAGTIATVTNTGSEKP